MNELQVETDKEFKNDKEKVTLSHIVPENLTESFLVIEIKEIAIIKHVVPIGSHIVGLQPYKMRKNL